MASAENLRLLRPYQEIGIQRIQAQPYILLADDYGLGKTAQALIALENYPRNLIICGNSVLRDHWKSEIRKWTTSPLPIIEVTGANRHITVPNYRMGWMVVGYDTIKLIPELQYYPFDSIILDEAHHIRNRNVKRSIYIRKLRATKKVALTRTSIINRPDDLWAILNFLNPEKFSSYWKWLPVFCHLEKTRWGFKVKGLRFPAKELYQRILGEFTLARTLEDVKMYLPPLIPIHHRFDLDPEVQAIHDRILTELIVEVDKGHLLINNALVANMRARQLCLHPPLVGVDHESPKLEFLRDLFEEPPGSAVIFSQFTKLHQVLRGAIPNSNYINGDVSDVERVKRLKHWQEHGGVLIGNQPIIGEGVDLSSAELLIWYDRPWSPAYIDQARHRIQRFGMKRPVRELILLTNNTVEGDMEDLINVKGMHINETFEILRNKYKPKEVQSA